MRSSLRCLTLATSRNSRAFTSNTCPLTSRFFQTEAVFPNGMEYSGLRSVRRNPNELEIPPRPKLHLGGKEPHKGYGPMQDQNPKTSKTYRLTWIIKLNKYHAPISKYEIFACIQRRSSVYVTAWIKIGEINRPSIPINQSNKSCNEHKVAVSRRITGFMPGFRYQIVVRGIDDLDRPGPYSIPAKIII